MRGEHNKKQPRNDNLPNWLIVDGDLEYPTFSQFFIRIISQASMLILCTFLYLCDLLRPAIHKSGIFCSLIQGLGEMVDYTDQFCVCYSYLPCSFPGTFHALLVVLGWGFRGIISICMGSRVGEREGSIDSTIVVISMQRYCEYLPLTVLWHLYIYHCINCEGV